MSKSVDCVVAGTCVVDVLVRPVELERPIGGDRLFLVEPLEVVTGGIVCNAGVAMARLGRSVAALAAVGDDDWAPLVRRRLEAEGIATDNVFTLDPDEGPTVTSTTAVLTAPGGERSFAHHAGASSLLSASHIARRDELFARSRVLLLGYYSLLPRLEPSMAEALRRVRALGCRVALDTGGGGGTMDPLERALPQLDYYLPSFGEASHQTGERDPEGAISRYRACGAAGVLGVKLGADGVLLSPSPGELVHVPCATPPGPVVDTTGAGDAFYGGFLAGVLGRLGVVEAARLGAATAACCITAHGASAGLRGYEQTKRVALAVG